MRVAYFSAGDVGAGHLVRGIAIGRAIARAGLSIEYRVFYGALRFAPPPGVKIESVAIDRGALGDRARARGSELARALEAFAPELLLVDLFWSPLRHVLPLAGCEAWLLVRDCPPTWLKGPFDAGLDARSYARVIGIEPGVSVAVRETIDPIVACNPDECHPREALRARLGVPEGKTLTLVAQAGAKGELDALVRARATDPREIVVASSVEDAAPLFPLAPWLAGADRIVGGAGYNLFWETRWLGLAARTELHPFPRTIDDQGRRVRLHSTHAPRANGADTLARLMR